MASLLTWTAQGDRRFDRLENRRERLAAGARRVPEFDPGIAVAALAAAFDLVLVTRRPARAAA